MTPMQNIIRTIGLILGGIAGCIAFVALWLFSAAISLLPLAVAVALGIWLFRVLA